MNNQVGPQPANAEFKTIPQEPTPQPVSFEVKPDASLAPDSNQIPPATDPEKNTQTLVQPPTPTIPEAVTPQPSVNQKISLNDANGTTTELTKDQIDVARQIIDSEDTNMANLAEKIANLQTPESFV